MTSWSFHRPLIAIGWLAAIVAPLALGISGEPSGFDLPKAPALDGTGPGWKGSGEADFAGVNCDAETWTWKDGVCTAREQPVGVDPHPEAGDQLRAGRPVEAPAIGR